MSSVRTNKPNAITVYGIKNCNTMKKCFDYLSSRQIAYDFVDYKKQAPSPALLDDWVALFGLQKLINKQGTTYKKQSDDHKAIIDQAISQATGSQAMSTNATPTLQAVYALISNSPSLLKRPIVVGEYQGRAVALIGFDEAVYDGVFRA